MGSGRGQYGLYSIQCILSTGDDGEGEGKTSTRLSYEGNIALYSLAKDINLQGALHVLQDSDLCSLSNKKDKKFVSKLTRIALVSRGNCSFEMKSRVAAQEGYEALIIVNTEKVIFPPGGSDSNFLPTLMISNTFWSDYAELCQEGSACPNLNVHLVYGEDPPSSLSHFSNDSCSDSKFSTS